MIKSDDRRYFEHKSFFPYYDNRERMMLQIFYSACRFTIDVRLEGYTKATESRRILVATNFYKRRPDRHVYHTTSEALFAT